jgi:lysophospholipase L1-like esterase
MRDPGSTITREEEDMDPNPRSIISRRRLIRTALAAGGASTLAAAFPALAFSAEERSLKKSSTVLFQGDSITDAGRNRGVKQPNEAGGFGRGYPYLLGAYLLGTRPEDDLKIYNRGISGNKVPDLDKRWQADAIDLEPDLISILIGVNDIWHKLGGRYQGTVADYEKGYSELLERTKKALPGARIVVCEPFVLRCGAVNDAWFPEFDQRRAAAKRVAEAAAATWVPFQSMFDEASRRAKPDYWARDGVHPTMAGHALVAATWWQCVKP